MPGLQLGEIESHPGRPLEDHLFQTACLAEKIALHNLGWVPHNLRTLCLLHDVAKAHTRFQARLKGRGRFPHAQPSAYIAYALSRDVILAEIIRCHHTHCRNDFINDFWYNTDYGEVYRILAEIPLWPGCKKILNELKVDCEGWQFLLPTDEDWDDLVDGLVDEIKLDVHNWLKFRLLNSLLITADRLDAINGGQGEIVLPTLHVADDCIQKHLASLKPTPLSPWRNKIRDSVLKRAENNVFGPGVYTLTLPTGAGKTLLGLELAIKISQRENKRGIIYVLPFITIVEQNSEVAKSIFPVVQEDHHLAYKDETEDMDMVQRFVSLFRYWNDSVVVTTFAKLWEVIYSPRANDSMSFHRLANSVVLLDEPQSIPARYWKGFGKTLEFLAFQLKTTFILITATQPGITSGKELAPPNIKIPNCRYTAKYFNHPVNISQMLDIIIQYGLSTRNTMIVANTRRAALEIFLTIREQKIVAETPFFLSSWLTPHDRKKIMQKIKDREEKKMPRNLVSTQVVEAGVDLDFDLVSRDIAPLDSLIQVAGRCNRHMADRKGQVLIFEIIDDKGNKLVKSVYDSILVNFTREVLQKFQKDDVITFNELEVPKLLKEYYSKLSEALEDYGPWFEIQQGKWECWDSLIDEPSYECTVFIDQNGDIKSILEELKNIDNKIEDKNKRRSLWHKVQEYAIGVPENELNNWYNISGSFIIDDEEKSIEKINDSLWIINSKGIGRIYRPDFGFIPLDFFYKYSQ